MKNEESGAKHSVFKEYDIRGIYGTELTDAMAYNIGRAFVTLTGCKRVAVGRDVRLHSEPLFHELARGIMDLGADVVDIGVCSTPESYFGNAFLNCDGSIMITASHNTKEYNGFKLCRANAVPISGATGLKDIEQICLAHSFLHTAAKRGTLSSADISEAYRAHVQATAHISRPLKIAVDFANGVGISEARALRGLPLVMDTLYDTFDGTFPNHEGNPLHVETLRDLQAKITSGAYDFGVAFDGDADRAGFIDEKGGIIPMDLATALMAQDILATHQGATVFYDLRSSWAVKETVLAAGGKPMMSRVGHSFIKQQMRDHHAVFAGELSGHYYFRSSNFTAESTARAVVALANILSTSDKPLSELVKPLRRYFASGEINTDLPDRAKAVAVMKTLKDTYGSQGTLLELDGISVEFDTWWFNVRCSNTEPLLRLNLESTTSEGEMIAKRDELLNIIRG